MYSDANAHTYGINLCSEGYVFNRAGAFPWLTRATIYYVGSVDRNCFATVGETSSAGCATVAYNNTIRMRPKRSYTSRIRSTRLFFSFPPLSLFGSPGSEEAAACC